MQVAAYAKNPDDSEATEKILAGIYPHFKFVFLRTCPAEIRQDFSDFFPELLDDDYKALIGLKDGACCSHACA